MPDRFTAVPAGFKRNIETQRISHLLSVSDTTGTFLSVTTGKFITNLWGFHSPDSDLTKLETLLVDRHHHLIRDNIDKLN